MLQQYYYKYFPGVSYYQQHLELSRNEESEVHYETQGIEISVVEPKIPCWHSLFLPTANLHSQSKLFKHSSFSRGTCKHRFLHQPSKHLKILGSSPCGMSNFISDHFHPFPTGPYGSSLYWVR